MAIRIFKTARLTGLDQTAAVLPAHRFLLAMLNRTDNMLRVAHSEWQFRPAQSQTIGAVAVVMALDMIVVLACGLWHRR